MNGKTFEELQEQVKSAILDDDECLDLPVGRCLPTVARNIVLDKENHMPPAFACSPNRNSRREKKQSFITKLKEKLRNCF